MRQPARWSPPISILPGAVLEPRRPLSSIVVGWVTAFVPSIVLAAAAATLMPSDAQPQIALDTPLALGLVIVFAPIVETLIMAVGLTVLLTFLAPAAAVLASAVCWGIAHSLIAPAWGLVVWWPFVVFSTLYVTWRSRSLLAALSIPAAVHALHNGVPATFAFFAS